MWKSSGIDARQVEIVAYKYYMRHGKRVCVVFFFQAEDGIRDLVRSRVLWDMYKRQREINIYIYISYA